jgi:hypothetical protein
MKFDPNQLEPEYGWPCTNREEVILRKVYENERPKSILNGILILIIALVVIGIYVIGHIN